MLVQREKRAHGEIFLIELGAPQRISSLRLEHRPWPVVHINSNHSMYPSTIANNWPKIFFSNTHIFACLSYTARVCVCVCVSEHIILF